MGYIPPTTAAEKSFIAGPAFVDFTQETASTAQLPLDSIDPNSATGSQVLQSIYDGETLLGQLASMASASPGMSAWVAQEEQTISQQIAHEFGLLIGSRFPLTYPEPIPGQGAASDTIDGMMDRLQHNHAPSNLYTAMSSVMAAIEQVDPGDTQLQQEGSSLQAALSAYLSAPTMQTRQALLGMESTFVQRLQSDGIGSDTFPGGGGWTLEGAIQNIATMDTPNS